MGRPDASFALVGEAPGLASIRNGRQWTGAGGMILRREIRKLGLDLEDLFYLSNAVKCWPASAGPAARSRPTNRAPRRTEAARCSPFLEAELAVLRPEVVVAVGAWAARALLGPTVRLPADHGRRVTREGREIVVLLHPANASRHPEVWPAYRQSLLALFGELAVRAGFPIVEVAAALVERRGRYLVSQRRPGQHLAGTWEFPGGKRQPGETLAQCLWRELDEELGVRPRIGPVAAVVPWAYPGHRVLIHFFRCSVGRQRPQPREGQRMEWVRPADLRLLPFPPPDAEMLRLL
jgi:8-oxo-dGTP diphosphatase